MVSRWSHSGAPRGREYDERFERLARAGHDVHGEASFVMGYAPRRVLDAGCGTGRIAIELLRRGCRVVGVDLDRSMLETAVEKAPEVEWFRADLASFVVPHPTRADHQRLFDAVVCAGNVMIFVQPGTEALVVERMASHLVDGGVLITGFQLHPDGYGVDQFDADCAAAGLVAEARFSSWSRDPWMIDSGYAVFVHRRPFPEPEPQPEPESGAGAESGEDSETSVSTDVSERDQTEA